jgi:hypothetical protein
VRAVSRKKRIGTGETVKIYYDAGCAWRKMSVIDPRIVFHLVTAYAESLHRELSERNVDLLVAARRGSLIDERLEFESLFDWRRKHMRNGAVVGLYVRVERFLPAANQ